jgi:hypothetical protein
VNSSERDQKLLFSADEVEMARRSKLLLIRSSMARKGPVLFCRSTYFRFSFTRPNRPMTVLAVARIAKQNRISEIAVSHGQTIHALAFTWFPMSNIISA